MMDKFAIGIDVGATNFRLGVVSGDGNIHRKNIGVIGRKRAMQNIVDLLATQVAPLKKDWPAIVGIGVGLPGIVQGDEGVVYQSPHYPEWKGVHFRKLFEDVFGIPTVIDNDANMVALGEAWMGAGRGLGNFILLTLGTGIGGGIVCGGKIWHGDQGFAGEVGHTLVDFNGPSCNCGNHGCLEMYASQVGIKHLIRSTDDPRRNKFLKMVKDSDPDNVTPSFLFDRARDGDIFASIIWKKFGAYLGAGIASLVNVLGINNIIIGGGISRAWDFFVKEAEKELSKRTYKKTAALVKLHKATLGDDAGIIGGARSVLY